MQKTTLNRLSCGMPLLLSANHDVAVATADVWVRTGAGDEPPEVGGISHFLEHMLFKGTAKFGLGEIERRIESVGGVSNAATSHDYTHYYITLPAAAIGTGIEMLAEMVRHSTLDGGELEKERLVILEEYRRKQDTPAGLLYEQLYAEAFETGPYHDPVIGTEETIRAIDRERMLDYYGKRYSPEDIALVVTGAFEPEDIIREAERAFGGFERPLVEMKAREAARFGLGKRVHVEKPTGGEVYVAYAFPAAGMNREGDVLPLDLAQTILGEGRAALLYQDLKEKRGLCSSVAAYYPTHAADSLFMIFATCLPEQRGPLREALIEDLARFGRETPAEPALRRALRLTASHHRFALETSGSLAVNIGYFYTLSGGTEFLDTYLERLDQVTPEAIQQTAERTLRPEELAAVMTEVAVGPDSASRT